MKTNEKFEYFQLKNIKYWSMEYMMQKQNFLLEISKKCSFCPILSKYFFKKFIKVSDKILSNFDEIHLKNVNV